jgi:hypothetical protein
MQQLEAATNYSYSYSDCTVLRSWEVSRLMR